MDSDDQPSVRLSPQERIALCNDIHRFSLLLGREAGGAEDDIGAATSPSPVVSSPWERLHLLAALRPRLEATLHAIAALPDSTVVPEDRTLPLHAARGNPATLARLARRPGDHHAWIHSSKRPPEATSPARVREQRIAHTVQTPPNRITAQFLQELAQEAQALHRLALFCEESAAAETAERLSQSAHSWLRRSPFCACLPRTGTERPLAVTTLLRSAPAYRSLYALLRTARSGLHIDWSESAILRFPTLEAWHLYEIWCFLRVGVALHALGWQPVETDCLQIGLSGMRLRLAHGKASRIRFRSADRQPYSQEASTDLHLTYQPLFASANQTSARRITGFRSLSHVMQPDISLECSGRLLLLDPKYRPYQEPGDEQEDVDKMHAYRDAIVRMETAAERAVPAVDAAWCLFPGTPAAPSTSQERLRAYPASTFAQPFGTAGVGAVQVRPGSEHTELIALLQHWLQSIGRSVGT